MNQRPLDLQSNALPLSYTPMLESNIKMALIINLNVIQLHFKRISWHKMIIQIAQDQVLKRLEMYIYNV